MSDDREIQAAFDRANLLSDSDRQMFLQGLSSDVRASVEKLLSEQSVQPLPVKDEFATVAPDAAEPAERPGDEKRPPVAYKSSSSHDMSSRRIGPYKLLQKLGEGGMGAVYMADQLEPVKRRVALKLIKSGMDSKEVVARFEAERQALAMMDHQNIAKVLDAGITDDGTPYFAMELVQGMPITKYCDREKLSIADRLKLFVQVCRALQHAHQKGVIHRDIKPSNVLVTQRDGVPVAKVIDFGLAKALQSEHRLTDKTLFTEVGQVCGTLEYMSPEQAEMNELGLDTRTDVYSLGVLLYELLTGSTPLGHERIIKSAFHRVLELIITEEAPRPSRRLSESGEAITGISDQRRIEPRRLSGILKRELDWIALKALEKDRSRRYDGAGSFADDVQHYLDGDVVTARPPSAGYRLRKAIRKHKAAFVSGTVFVLLLLAGLVGTGTMWLRASTAEAVAKREQEKSQQNLIVAETYAYNSDMRVAQLDWEVSNIGQLRKKLDRYRSRLDLKGFEWDYFDRISNSQVLTLKGHTAKFTPDGKRIVSASSNGTLQVWDARSGQATLTLRGHTPINISADGKRIVSAGNDDRAVSVWDMETGQETLTLKEVSPSEVYSVSFSPDGKRIVSAGKDNLIKMWDAETGQRTLTLEAHEAHSASVYSVSFSPDGKRIVSAGSNNLIKMWDAETGQRTLTLEARLASVHSVSFSPDGKRIVGGSDDQTVMVWDAENGQVTRTLLGHSARVNSANFSVDGKRIISGSDDQTVMVWDAENGQVTLTLQGHSARVNSANFSLDGKRIVTGSDDKTVKVWDAETGRLAMTLKGHTGAVESVSFSPDGTWIVSESDDQTAMVWDAQIGDEVMILKGRVDNVRSVNFSPDGNRIVSDSDEGVCVWDAETGLKLRTLSDPSPDFVEVIFTPDGRRIVGLSCTRIIYPRSYPWRSVQGESLTAVAWDVESGSELWTDSLSKINCFIRAVSFSSDSKHIVSRCDGGGTFAWDVETGQPYFVESEQVETVYGLQSSPNGKRGFTLVDDHTVRFPSFEWSDQPSPSARGFNNVNSVNFSVDGKRIVTGSDDSTVTVWDAETHQLAMTLEGHSRAVLSVKFSPDGKRIVSGSDDNTVKLWDAEAGYETLTLSGHTAEVYIVGFSRDGKRIISGSDDHTLRIWDARPWNAEQRVARQAGRVVDKAWQEEFTIEGAAKLIRADQTITESVRQKALRLVEAMSGRAAAELNDVSWKVVRSLGLTHADYEKAQRQIEAAIEFAPNNGMYLKALAVAQYRVGEFQAALSTLTRSEQLNSKVFGGSSASDLVFIAMTNQQLGNTDQAKEQLQQVRVLIKEPHWSEDRELRSFLNEAEALIEPAPAPEAAAAEPVIPPQTVTPSASEPAESPEVK